MFAIHGNSREFSGIEIKFPITGNEKFVPQHKTLSRCKHIGSTKKHVKPYRKFNTGYCPTMSEKLTKDIPK